MEVGSAYNYEQLLDGIKQQALDKIGGDKLQKISGLLGTAGIINAELGQFGFYKTLGNMFKESAKEAVAQVNKPSTPLGTEGTGMKEFQPTVETQISPEVENIQKGIFGREILGDKPVPPPAQAPSPEQQPSIEGQPEDVVDVERPVVPTEIESNFGDLLDGAKSSLASNVDGMTQSVKGSLFGRASQVYDKAVDYKQSLEAGLDRIQTLRNKATDFAQQLKSQAGDVEAQGRSLIQQGQEALSRGEQAGQDLITQGQGLLDKSLQTSMNSELFQTAMETAQDKITRGQTLLNNGDQTGMKLLEDGQEQLQQAQSAIKGYGTQARQFGDQIQSEIEGRTQQLNDLAENLMSQAKTGLQGLSDIGTAIKSGDVQGAVQGLQAGAKTAGQLAEKAGIEGGAEIGTTISEAIPVVGEVVSAGLLIASLFTGFAPHEQASSITTATTAFGV